jgi:hypothetical protein
MKGITPSVLLGSYLNTIGVEINTFSKTPLPNAVILFLTLGAQPSLENHSIFEQTAPLFENCYLVPKTTKAWEWEIMERALDSFAFYDNILIHHPGHNNSRTTIFILNSLAKYGLKHWVRRYIATYHLPFWVKIQALHDTNQLFSYTSNRCSSLLKSFLFD